MQMHIVYTVVYPVFILAKQLNVIVEFTNVTFAFLSIFIFLSIYGISTVEIVFFPNQIGLNLVEQINQW